MRFSTFQFPKEWRDRREFKALPESKEFLGQPEFLGQLERPDQLERPGQSERPGLPERLGLPERPGRRGHKVRREQLRRFLVRLGRLGRPGQPERRAQPGHKVRKVQREALFQPRRQPHLQQRMRRPLLTFRFPLRLGWLRAQSSTSMVLVTTKSNRLFREHRSLRLMPVSPGMRLLAPMCQVAHQCLAPDRKDQWARPGLREQPEARALRGQRAQPGHKGRKAFRAQLAIPGARDLRVQPEPRVLRGQRARLEARDRRVILEQLGPLAQPVQLARDTLGAVSGQAQQHMRLTTPLAERVVHMCAFSR
jgi:hypothetical protein